MLSSDTEKSETQPAINNELITELYNLQKRILARRGGILLDIDDALAQIRIEQYLPDIEDKDKVSR